MLWWKVTTKSLGMVSVPSLHSMLELQSCDVVELVFRRMCRGGSRLPIYQMGRDGVDWEFACLVLQQIPGWCRWLFPLATTPVLEQAWNARAKTPDSQTEKTTSAFGQPVSQHALMGGGKVVCVWQTSVVAVVVVVGGGGGDVGGACE
jgi:hypothetical protein